MSSLAQNPSPKNMDTTPQSPAQPKDWKDLYLAALLENNQEKIPTLISEAECAIIERARALFTMSGDNIQEEESLDDALYALRALRNCLAVRGRYPEAA